MVLEFAHFFPSATMLIQDQAAQGEERREELQAEARLEAEQEEVQLQAEAQEEGLLVILAEEAQAQVEAEQVMGEHLLRRQQEQAAQQAVAAVAEEHLPLLPRQLHHHSRLQHLLLLVLGQTHRQVLNPVAYGLSLAWCVLTFFTARFPAAAGLRRLFLLQHLQPHRTDLL